MNEKLDEIQAIHEQQLKWSFRALIITGFFAVLISLSRFFVVGWQNIMALHIGVYLIVVATVLLERYFSFFLRASLLIGMIFILGISGIASWGLTGFGVPALIICCVLCTIFFGFRSGIVSAIISTVCFVLISVAFRFNILSLHFDPNIYLNSISAWASGFITIILSAGLVVISLGTINTKLRDLIKKLDQRNIELLGLNKKLLEEIHERERLAQEKTVLQTKLRRAEKMEVVASVAGGVAHDLNNVLAGTVGYPDILCMKLPSDSPLRESLEKMKKSGLKAAAIVSDLLTLVRRGLVTRKTTNINFLVSEYLNSPEFEKLKSYHPDVEIEAFMDENLWNMEGSSIHIIKTIMNLISNGVESISGRGTLTLTTRNQTVTKAFSGYNDEITPGEYVVLKVTDTGSGMSPEEMENIFEPFYSKKVMGKSGTGLGMTVVWGAVKDHDGHIEIQSKEDKGTSISIYFPACRKEIVNAEILPNLEDYRGNGESILVIDDVPEQREVAVALLTTLGYSAMALPNGEAALQYLQNFPTDLILLDMIMYPGMDGLDTYKEIVKLYPSQKTIIASGYCETERVKQVQKLGCGNCLVKPFTLEKLGRTVKSELTTKRI